MPRLLAAVSWILGRHVQWVVNRLRKLNYLSLINAGDNNSCNTAWSWIGVYLRRSPESDYPDKCQERQRATVEAICAPDARPALWQEMDGEMKLALRRLYPDPEADEYMILPQRRSIIEYETG
jgi:hypothetical protein